MRTNVKAPLKNPVHRSSRREEAQTSSPQPSTLNSQPNSQSLVTSAATIAFSAALLLANSGSALAAVRYVDVNNAGAMWPYTSWATAASGIQEAIEIAEAGDEIVVTNGIYSVGGRSTIGQSTTTNRVVVDKPLALRSVNGPESTIIDGGGVFRCVYLINGATLSGFTVTNGRAPAGGGLFCESTNAVVSNCVVSGNSSFVQYDFLFNPPCCERFDYGASAGGVYGGTLNNCILNHNLAETVTSLGLHCDIINCAPIHDGLYVAYRIPGLGGGACNAILNHCTVTSNSAGYGGGTYGCTLNNCTLAFNSATAESWVDFDCGGGAFGSKLNNCIVYFNTARHGGTNYDSSSTLNYSCTIPLPTNGVGNITNAPLFVNSAAGNYRLRPDSPCIDAGTNLSASITNDLDGRPRPLDGNGDGLAAFDMGAYEYRTPLLVWQNSPNPAPPHADWATAAHTIQDAVDAAVAGDEIVVTNGIYATGGRAVDGTITNRVAVDKPLTLRSVNGPQFTIIRGHQVPGTINGDGAIRCVYLANGASLSGFTLTNGATRAVYDPPTIRESSGGGLRCESTNAVVSNCVLAANSAWYGAGAYGGTLNNCTLSGNWADNGDDGGAGGGAYNSTLNNCTLSGNRAGGFLALFAAGGGAYGCTLNNCTLSGNSAVGGGGGAADGTLNNCILSGNMAGAGGGASGCTLNTCTLTGNSANGSGVFGGAYGGGGAYRSTLNNCALSGNSTHLGAGGGARFSTLNNCTVTGNSSGGVYGCTLNNCIVYFNTGANYAGEDTLNYSCTTPQPTNGVGNITNAPLFVDTNGWNNLGLQSNSPCINAGRNAFAPAGPDLDGNPRIVGGSVDMGAYEFQLPTSRISYAWLQQYALSTDGSADTADSDGDGLNNWQEWRCATDPNNALSALRMLAPALVGSDLLVRWESVADRTYFLERSTAASSAFTPLATGISGHPGTMTFTHTNAIGAGPWFYRVGVSTP